jgi:hypothetical protein
MVKGTAVGLRKLKMQWRRHGEGGAGPMVSTRHGGGGGLVAAACNRHNWVWCLWATIEGGGSARCHGPGLMNGADYYLFENSQIDLN